LTTASKETASRLDREDGGPLPTGTLLNLLLPHVKDPVGGVLVRDVIELQMARLETIGTYYPTHAEYSMRLARARHASGDLVGAREAWEQGAVFLGAYGWRKDITVFDVIESAPALVALSRDAALRGLADVQPLANAVVAHTDGRETNRAPNAWLRRVLEVHPAAGIAVLARTLTEEHDQGSWPNVQAVHDVAEAARDAGDPALLDALLATLRFEVEHQDHAAKSADSRVAPILRLLVTDPPLAAQALRRVAAEVSGDGRRYTEGAAARLAAVATEHGVAIPCIAAPPEGRPSNEPHARSRPWQGTAFHLPGMRVPPFPPNATLVDILTGLRTAGAKRRWDDDSSWDDVVLALGYHLGQLIDAGREDDARRLLRFFARDADVASGREHPLGRLAATLEAAGYVRPAAVAYALAYTATRGGSGWQHMGDKAHGHLIERAIALDPGTARQVVADEVAYALRGRWYSSGTSRHLVERLAAWGEPQAAEAAWREAFLVVRHRLPLAADDGWFGRLRDEKEPEWPDERWSVDEALVALLPARTADPRLAHKVNALAGVARAIERRPVAVAVPMRWWLTRNTHVTSALVALHVLGSTETAPYPITNAVEDVLRQYAACDLWGPRRLAAKLLERAGRPVTGAVPATCVDGDSASLEPEPARRRALLSTDVSGALDEIAPLWPDLPRCVIRRLDAFFAVQQHRERAGARYRIAHGRDGDAYPPTPTLRWEVELFEVTLHRVLCGLSERLWASGRWEPGLEDALLRRVLPNVRLHLGLAASRTARPAWPSAESVADGIGVLPALGDEDPTYAGWTRLALVERRYRPDPTRSYRPPVEAITVLSGAVAVPLGGTIPPDAFPFKDGDVNDWWEHDPPPATVSTCLPMGPVVGLRRASDWLGSTLVLIPPTILYGCSKRFGLSVCTRGPAWSERSATHRR
jgi:hypothetical protein